MKDLKPVENLADSFSLFPSIGSKTAERMAYALLDMDENDVKLLIKNIEDVKEKIHPCPICGVLTDESVCSICADQSRNHETCIVVAQSKDILPFEKIGNFNGVFHVLGGLINPSKNITPETLKINELADRIKKESIKELIIATNATPEGEITALYLSKIFDDENVKITRLAYGMPIGASFEYIDSLTLEKALNGRTKLK